MCRVQYEIARLDYYYVIVNANGLKHVTPQNIYLSIDKVIATYDYFPFFYFFSLFSID